MTSYDYECCHILERYIDDTLAWCIISIYTGGDIFAILEHMESVA